jgi:predicted nucleic acid-binding protein
LNKKINSIGINYGNNKTIPKEFELLDQYILKNGLKILEALIAAIAITEKCALVTRDIKIEELKIKKI